MSDRSKKILWIAVAVSGFALVVFLMAFILFPPSEISQSKPFDLTGRSPGKVQSANDFSAFPSIVVQSSGNDAQTQSPDQTSVNGQSPDNSVVVLPAPAANQSAAPASNSSAPAASSAPPAPKPAASTPAPSPTPAPAAAKTSATSGAEYWIQVGSFSEKATADKLRGEFESRGMTSIIATKVVGGRNYYQVKVGPYASSDEAKKWIGTVKSVPGSSQDAFITTR